MFVLITLMYKVLETLIVYHKCFTQENTNLFDNRLAFRFYSESLMSYIFSAEFDLCKCISNQINQASITHDDLHIMEECEMKRTLMSTFGKELEICYSI